MTYFPALNSRGLRVQLPAQSSQLHATRVEDQPSGLRYATALRTNPQQRWRLNYPQLTTSEVATLEAFFVSQRGAWGEWTWLDPSGNLCEYSDDFGHSSWTKSSASVVGTAVDRFGGSLARLISGSTNGILSTPVLPDGDGVGIMLCASCWVYASAAQSLLIGFADSGGTLLTSRTWSLAMGWQLIHCNYTVATASAIRLQVGGANTWAGATLRLFGARCAPLCGPGEYVRSPGNYGLHRKCRFDSDAVKVTYTGPGLHSASVDVITYS